MFSAGIAPHIEREDKSKYKTVKQDVEQVIPQTAATKTTKLSFEDYHKTWSGIATSKYKSGVSNPCK